MFLRLLDFFERFEMNDVQNTPLVLLLFVIN